MRHVVAFSLSLEPQMSLRYPADEESCCRSVQDKPRFFLNQYRSSRRSFASQRWRVLQAEMVLAAACFVFVKQLQDKDEELKKNICECEKLSLLIGLIKANSYLHSEEIPLGYLFTYTMAPSLCKHFVNYRFI